MSNILQTILGDLLIGYGNKIKDGSCELDNDETENLLGLLAHLRMTKELSCKLLNISRSKFDELVSLNKLPKGKKITGLKELVWYKDEVLVKMERLLRLNTIHKLKEKELKKL